MKEGNKRRKETRRAKVVSNIQEKKRMVRKSKSKLVTHVRTPKKH